MEVCRPFLANFLAKFGIWGVGDGRALAGFVHHRSLDLILARYVLGRQDPLLALLPAGPGGLAVGGLLPYGLAGAAANSSAQARQSQNTTSGYAPALSAGIPGMMIPSMLPRPHPGGLRSLPPASSRWRVVPSCCLLFAEGLSAGWYYPLVLKLGPGAVDVVEATADSPLLAIVRRLEAVAGFAGGGDPEKRAGSWKD